MELLMTVVIMSMTIIIIVSLLRMIWTLHRATMAGKQELILTCTEMNQFGLPRAVDDVEVGLSRLIFHVNPLQVRFKLGRLILTTTMLGTHTLRDSQCWHCAT